MIKTVHLKILKQAYIFQKDLVLEVAAEPHLGDGKDILDGYYIPDTGDGSPGILPANEVKKVKTFREKEPYFGKCLLTKVSNFYKNPDGQEREAIGANEFSEGIIKPEQVRIIHYPNCQQLVFHMPKPAYDAGNYQLTNDTKGEILENLAVRDRLNGSTMMLINTLPYKPGFYTIEASWPNGWTHQIRFIKFTEGFPNAKSTNIPYNVRHAIKGEECHLHPPIEPNPSRIKLPRDMETGFLAPRIFTSRSTRKPGVSTSEISSPDVSTPGVSTPERSTPDVAERDIFMPVMTYTQDGRGGKIYYQNGDVFIDFDWEFATGNAVVFFPVPDENSWERRTKTPLSSRDEILNFVAKKVITDKAPGCHFRIFLDRITIFRGALE